VVGEPVDYGGDGDGVPEGLRPGGEVLVRGDDERALFVAAEMREKKREAASGSKGMYPTSSMTMRGIRPSRSSSSASFPARFALDQ
jgi:hypothetical protein